MEIGNEIKNVHDKVEHNKPAPTDIVKHMEKVMRSIDIGQQLMPGRTRGQMREALAIAEENFDNFYDECDCRTIGNDEPRNVKEAWWHTDQTKKRNGERQSGRNSQMVRLHKRIIQGNGWCDNHTLE